MLTLGLLNADLDASDIAGIDKVHLYRLTPSEKVEFERTLPTFNAIIADLNLVNVDSFRFLTEFRERIIDRVRDGALLLCFTSRPNLHSPDGVRNKYSWLPFYDPGKDVREDLIDRIQIKQTANGISDAFSSHSTTFYATCSFPNGFGTTPYDILLEGDDGSAVGLGKEIGKGRVLLLPQSEQKQAVVRSVLEWWNQTLSGGKAEAPAPPAEAPSSESTELEVVSAEAGSSESGDESVETLAAGEGTAESSEQFEVETGDAGDGADAADLGALAAPASVPAESSPPASMEAASDSDFLGAPESSEPPKPASAFSSMVDTSFESDVQRVFGDARDELDALMQRKSAPREESPVLEPPPPEPAKAAAPPAPSSAVATKLPMPEWLEDFKAKAPNLSDLVSEARRLEEEAGKLQRQAAEVRGKISSLSKWDGLLFQPASQAAGLVSEFFQSVLKTTAEGVSSPVADRPAIRVQSAEADFLIHVITLDGPIDEAAGRDLMRHLADEDPDTKGVLVVNGFLGKPLPADAEQHATGKLLKLAQRRGLVIVPVSTLYRIGLAAQREEGWQAEPLLEAFADQSGMLQA